MDELVVIALAGFLAAMVDGALGMGFGPTSASILLSSGLSPAATSATVNLAKVATGLVSGVSHWRFGNIDRRLVIRLALPGACGAVVGATVLAATDGDDLRPVLALMLLTVGVRLAMRFSRPLPGHPAAASGSRGSGEPSLPRGTELAGAAGGLTNGLVGAWGPVVTPFLLHRGLPPRVAVGSVNTAEVAVATVSAGSLLGSLGGNGIELAVVLAMLGGGVVAAPLAAYVVRFLPARILGLAVAGLLLVTQSRELGSSGWLPVDPRFVYVAVTMGIAYAAARPRMQRGLLVPNALQALPPELPGRRPVGHGSGDLTS
ncbi:MAG: sulfite exporter TauE/SafE family protein [Microthrixaceae bacterium]